MIEFKRLESMWIMSSYEDDVLGATTGLANGAPYVVFGQEPRQISSCPFNDFG